MWTTIVSAAVLLAAALVTAWRVLDIARARRRVGERNLAQLAALGLSVEPAKGGLRGDGTRRPQRLTLSGEFHGVSVQLRNDVEVEWPPRPPITRGPACLVEFHAPLPDLVAWISTNAEGEPSGRFPFGRVLLHRMRTGHAPFDRIYELYAASDVSHEADFRTAPDREGSPIFPTAILDSMRDLMMGFVRVRDGRVELAFAPLASSLLEQAMLTAVAVASHAAKRPFPAIPPGEFASPPLLPVHTLLVFGWVVVVALGWFAGSSVAMTNAAVGWNSDLLCGSAGRAVIADGVIYCGGVVAPATRASLHTRSCVLATAAALSVLLVAGVFARTRWARAPWIQ